MAFPRSGQFSQGFPPSPKPHPTRRSAPRKAETSHTQLGDRQDTENYLAQLPEDIRIVVSLRIFRDLSYYEIAKKFKIPVGTATWRMKHGLGIIAAACWIALLNVEPTAENTIEAIAQTPAIEQAKPTPTPSLFNT